GRRRQATSSPRSEGYSSLDNRWPIDRGDSTTPTVKDPLAPGPRGGRIMSAAPRGSCPALSRRRGGQRGNRRGGAVQRPRPTRGSCPVPLPELVPSRARVTGG